VCALLTALLAQGSHACTLPESPQAAAARLQQARAKAAVIVQGDLRPARNIAPTSAYIIAKRTLRGKAHRRYYSMGFIQPCIYRSEPIRNAKFYLYEIGRPGNYMIAAVEMTKQ
jgi:hypothetical protein